MRDLSQVTQLLRGRLRTRIGVLMAPGPGRHPCSLAPWAHAAPHTPQHSGWVTCGPTVGKLQPKPPCWVTGLPPWGYLPSAPGPTFWTHRQLCSLSLDRFPTVWGQPMLPETPLLPSECFGPPAVLQGRTTWSLPPTS